MLLLIAISLLELQVLKEVLKIYREYENKNIYESVYKMTDKIC